MKAVINKITFKKVVPTKYGERFAFDAEYNDKTASFLANKKVQDTFVAGKENEFTETPREHNGRTYWNIKAIKQQGNSNFSRNMKREQSKYSGFACSYAKDLVVANMVEIKDMLKVAKKMMDWMVEQDKALEND